MECKGKGGAIANLETTEESECASKEAELDNLAGDPDERRFVVFIRHGNKDGSKLGGVANVEKLQNKKIKLEDDSIYGYLPKYLVKKTANKKPNWRKGLTGDGWEDAKQLGKIIPRIAEKLGAKDHGVEVVASPFRRTIMTGTCLAQQGEMYKLKLDRSLGELTPAITTSWDKYCKTDLWDPEKNPGLSCEGTDCKFFRKPNECTPYNFQGNEGPQCDAWIKSLADFCAGNNQGKGLTSDKAPLDIIDDTYVTIKGQQDAYKPGYELDSSDFSDPKSVQRFAEVYDEVVMERMKNDNIRLLVVISHGTFMKNLFKRWFKSGLINDWRQENWATGTMIFFEYDKNQKLEFVGERYPFRDSVEVGFLGSQKIAWGGENCKDLGEEYVPASNNKKNFIYRRIENAHNWEWRNLGGSYHPWKTQDATEELKLQRFCKIEGKPENIVASLVTKDGCVVDANWCQTTRLTPAGATKTNWQHYHCMITAMTGSSDACKYAKMSPEKKLGSNTYSLETRIWKKDGNLQDSYKNLVIAFRPNFEPDLKTGNQYVVPVSASAESSNNTFFIFFSIFCIATLMLGLFARYVWSKPSSSLEVAFIDTEEVEF